MELNKNFKEIKYISSEGGVYWYRTGNIVQLIVVNKYMNARTIPSGFKPKSGLMHFLVFDGTSQSVKDIYYTNNGSKFISEDHNYYGTLTWMTDEDMPS